MPDLSLRLNKDLLIVDGALGTLLLSEGIPADACLEFLTLLDPELIESLHRRYVNAGAQCVCTNTFGASRARLEAHGLAEHVEEINKAGVALARNAGAPHVLASMGPCGLKLAPHGGASFDEVYAQYAEQASALAAAKPDALLIETMTDIADAVCAVHAAKDACELLVMASCSFSEDGLMPASNTDAATAARLLEEAGADVVGINCGAGPASVLKPATQMAACTTLPLIVQASAGIPTRDARGALRYPASTDEMVASALALRALGVQFIGSCCGSTPAVTGALYATVGDSNVVVRALS
jgi:methionine synthase I (cobalamin-dependent)